MLIIDESLWGLVVPATLVVEGSPDHDGHAYILLTSAGYDGKPHFISMSINPEEWARIKEEVEGLPKEENA
jgi:hypothetical protein